jgi:two-component system, sensor histidine kinase
MMTAKPNEAASDMIDAQYLAEVLHELRSPLGGIDAMAEILNATDLSAEQSRLVQGLIAASKHLRAIADDILDQQTLKNNAILWQENSFSLKEMVQAISVSAEARASAKGIWFSLHSEDNLPEYVISDQRCIRQMLENLLDNAIKVTSQGKITLSISSVKKSGQFLGLRFEVQDTGPGFTAREKISLFKAFGRLNNDVKGSGLGLSMVHRLACAVGGEVDCESVLGQGATFWFTISVRTESAKSSKVEQKSISNEQNNLILVVDDNQSNRQIMQVMLEHFGYQTVEAESGEKALEILSKTTVAAVMLDQTLSGISGLETLSAIRRSKEAWAEIPVIPVTGRVSNADHAAFAKAGAVGFVEKPINARSIRNALELALELEVETKKSVA